MSRYQVLVPADAPLWARRMQAPINDVFNRIAFDMRTVHGLVFRVLDNDPPIGPGDGLVAVYAIRMPGGAVRLRMQVESNVTPIDIAFGDPSDVA